MISAICWIPKGVAKVAPEELVTPTKEEIEELVKNELMDGSQDLEGEQMDVENSEEDDEVAQAKSALKELNKEKDISDALSELDMDNYDDEEDGFKMFSNVWGDRVFPSNKEDNYLENGDDDDEEDDIEDTIIMPSDLVVVSAYTEDDVGYLQVWICEELDDGATNLYCHHDVILSSFPLSIAWLDCNPNGGDTGNFVAVGSMEPSIELWDLDRVHEVQPIKVLGGYSKEKGKKKKKGVMKFVEGSHTDSVLSLAWNKDVRNVLASASADHSVKIWDVAKGECVLTLKHHTDKVQAVSWNRHSPEVLLSGSFDKSIVMMDLRDGENSSNKWSIPADVESLLWDPHNEHSFVTSLENGSVQAFDSRMASSKPLFDLHAHSRATTSISFNRVAPNFLATASVDKEVKLWDISNGEPSLLASKRKAGAVFAVSFSDDCPFLLTFGGSKGRLEMWNTLSEQAVRGRFGQFAQV